MVETSFTTPCEVAAKRVVPAIRAALAIILVKEYGLSAYRVAKLFGLTPAAISNYLLKRRGGGFVDKLLNDSIVRTELVKLAERIISDDEASANYTMHLCKICRLVRARIQV